MRKHWGIIALLPLAAACGSHAAGAVQTHVLGVQATRPAVACTGWFVMSGSTLTAHVALTAPAKSLHVTATGVNDGATDLGVTRVSNGALQQVLRFHGITDTVTAVTVQLPAGRCSLINPH